MDKKEIRDILLGRIIRLDEQLWAAAPADAKFHFHGIKDGAGDVRLFGVSHLDRAYCAETELPVAFASAEEALHAMGRPMQLASAPAAKACLYAPNWIAPVLLVLARDGDKLGLTAYTGRSLLIGKMRCRIAMMMFEHKLPAGITRTEVSREKKSEKPKEKREKPKRAAGKKKEKKPPKSAKKAKRKQTGGKRLAK